MKKLILLCLMPSITIVRVRKLISQAHANVNALVRPHLTPFIAAIERNFTSAALTV